MQIGVLRQILGIRVDEKTRRWRGITRRLIIYNIYEIRERNSGRLIIYGQVAHRNNWLKCLVGNFDRKTTYVTLRGRFEDNIKQEVSEIRRESVEWINLGE